MESQPLQQPAAAMNVDFDAVFGNKTTPSNGSQPTAGKAHSVWLSRQCPTKKNFLALPSAQAFN